MIFPETYQIHLTFDNGLTLLAAENVNGKIVIHWDNIPPEAVREKVMPMPVKKEKKKKSSKNYFDQLTNK